MDRGIGSEYNGTASRDVVLMMDTLRVQTTPRGKVDARVLYFCH